MLVWLITVGEPLPSDGPCQRLLRTGILANHLTKLGHTVVWWTSAFDHTRKQKRPEHSNRQAAAQGLTIRLLPSCSYKSNVSFARLHNHRQLKKAFHIAAAAEKCVPDVVLCSWPVVELCVEATRYGTSRGVPVVLDVRDLWPHAIVDLAPHSLRGIARFLLRKCFKEAQEAATQATAITGITDAIVSWGVRLSGRQRNQTDRPFPMAYTTTAISDADFLRAQSKWANLGMRGDGSQFIVCFFGTLGRHFELSTVASAARLLYPNFPDIKFVICGTGPDLMKWRTAARHCENLLVPGIVNGAEIKALMATARVGLAPYVSTWDFMMSIPNKPIEYMSAGLPVVSSLKGELATLLQTHQTGITYENGDPADLAAAMAYCYQHRARLQQMSMAATCLFREKFSAESVYSEMASYLQALAANAKKQSAAQIGS